VSRLPALAVAVLLVAAGCSADDGAEAKGQSAKEKETVCILTGIVTDVFEKRKLDTTFTDIVEQTKPNVVNSGVSAIVGIALAEQDAEPTKVSDFGPYLPALTYLAERGAAWDDEPGVKVEEPERTDDVVKSAERLDKDLADGLCKP
jgi:hypothetical protein